MKQILLDPWQKEVLETKGNIVLRSGRQVGKSTVIGLKTAKYALENADKLVMVISKTERQAGLLFAKILFNIHQIDRVMIKKGKDRPTKHIINLKNGTAIHCLPAGDTGFGIMGFTIDLLIADEAAFIPEEVWNSIIPALAITRGDIWLLSTPFVKEGYYYNCFSDDTFTSFHTSSENCPRKDEAFLAHKKATITKGEYSQMYLGEFLEEGRRFFDEDLIRKCCILKRRMGIIKERKYYLGCDVARMDLAEFTFEIVEMVNKNKIIHVESIVTRDVPIHEFTRNIIALNLQYNFRKEYIDSGGMGITVCDLLRESNADKRKVVEINNASRIYDRDEHKKKIVKEDGYKNLKKLMEKGEIQILDDDEIKASLRCIQAEHDKETGRMFIWGTDSHIVEGLWRAAYCTKDKSLNIYVY